MIDAKGFSGILDTDNPPSGVAAGGHMMAFNGRFKGIQSLLQYQNVEGNREISFTLPEGDNECCGAFYSTVDNYLYWCNWNSEGSHCIFQIYMPTETVTNVLQSGVNTDGDILNFDLDYPIHSMNILYGSDGNFLYYVDSLGRPTEINLELFINSPYTVTKREYIDVAKAPFIMPPKVSYENDENATANNFRNSLFQFRYRPIYDNNEKPVSSSGSEVALPYLPYDINIQKDVTKNARICVYVQTGDVNVKAIQIEGRYSSDNFVSDWLKITVLDKSELSIADNTVYRYLFLNDGVYPTLPTEGSDPTTQVLNLQDYVPRQANTQCLLNGNSLGYAGITEGYDKIEADMTIESVSAAGTTNNKNGILFFAEQNGLASVGTENEIAIYLAGVGDNDPTTNEPITLSNSLNAEFHVRARVGVSTDKSFTYTETTANATIASILTAIQAAAIGVGYAPVSLGANYLIVSLTDVVLQSSQVFCADAISVNESIYVNALRASYADGIQYFDSKGRTNGVVYAASFSTLPTVDFTTAFELNIYHRPPTWARYYHVVRSKNTTYNKLLNWVTESSFSNISPADGLTYAYLGISSIAEYNQQISSSTGVVSYEFQKGDRIRFIARYLFDNTADTTGMDNLDYEILGTVNNPIVDGEIKEGTYVKIAYPTTDISGNFKLDGSDEFQNYHIWLYNKSDRLDPSLQFYYEHGQQYGIGNAGTNTAYHAGMTQSQSEDLSLPAKILLDKGDWFLRYRKVVSGINYTAQAGGNEFGNRYSTARIIFPDDVTNASYEIRSNTAHPADTSAGSYPTFADTDYLFYNKSIFGVSIKIKATLDVFVNGDTVIDVYLKQAGIITPPGEQIITIIDGVSIGDEQSKQIIIDGVYYVAPGCKVWMLIGNESMTLYAHVRAYSLTLEVLKYTNIQIVERSLSDLYNIQLNANSRVTVIDENAAEVYFPTKFRWGLSYLQDANINNINRFYAPNYDEWDRSKGDVRRLKARERILKIFQSKGVGRVGIYTKFVQDNAGTQILTTSDDIITKNNIDYYQGELGIGDYPTNLISTDSFDGFIDPIRGQQVISDNAGLRIISDLYLGQYYIGDLLGKYTKEWIKPDNSRAKIMHVYNYVDEEWHCLLEGGENGDEDIANYNFCFNLRRKGYSSFYDWHPEWSIGVEEKMVSWKNGELWVHDDRSTYCNFFGVQYDCNITLPFNRNQIEKKGWKGLVQQSNVIWTCPEIYTQVMSYGNVPQESVLTVQDFRLKEGMYHASFRRDSNSVKGINNGDVLKGSYVVIKFQPINSGNFVFLTSVTTKFLDSPLVPR
jgi:hypothetical protein